MHVLDYGKIYSCSIIFYSLFTLFMQQVEANPQGHESNSSHDNIRYCTNSLPIYTTYYHAHFSFSFNFIIC